MAFVYKILFFLATSFLLMSKSHGVKWIDESRSPSASSNEAGARAAKGPRASKVNWTEDQLSADQVVAASRRDGDLWQTFQVAATDPELTDPSNVKPNPETLIDWYFHAADMKTKLDRQSNDLSPKYIAAGKNDRPVMNFQSTQNTPVNNINHKLFKYDDLANEDVEASHHHQQQHQRRGRHQPGEQLSRINDSPWSTSPSGETDEPLVTDYGARRTNDASMWYLRRFKSSDDTPTDVQLKQQNQNERFSSSPTHHWPGSIDQTDSQYDMSGKKQDQYDGGQKKHRAHVNHQRYPSEGEYMQRQQQQSPQQEQQNYLGSPLGNEGAFHSRASSDHQYAKNNGNPSSIFKQASAVTTWEEQFPISDEFDSAFNSVVAGGDPIANNRIKSTDSHHQHSQAKKQQKSTQPIVDSFKYDYESASGPASSHNDDRPGPSSYAPQSKAGYSSRSPSVQPNMYEPVGYPRRFYRLKL